jgi:acetolactate synthase-1/2/3 large subunit
MAADGYARATGKVGVAVATSGPGATNLLTGICGAFYDSVPVLYITGQVSTFRLRQDTRVRQLGFQETDIVEICRPVTKSVTQVLDPSSIRYELEKALFMATSGRPGPVLVDIPDNIQRMDVDVSRMTGFLRPSTESVPDSLGDQTMLRCERLLRIAKRPVLIAGWGVHLAHAEKDLIQLVEKLSIPVTPTWAAADLLPADHPLLVGTFGTHGTRYGNFAVQNADLLLAIGSRLDTKATGSPPATFAREAKKIVVDVDAGELAKFQKLNLCVDVPIHADAKAFMKRLSCITKARNQRRYDDWVAKIQRWKTSYPICPEKYYKEKLVNPYVMVKELSQNLDEEDVIIVDTGCTLAWVMQAFEFKNHQRLYHDFNNTARGCALPAAIGVGFANRNKRIVCITGDGGLLLNVQELAGVIKAHLPVKIVLVNNHGYSMIRQTQDQWLGSHYLASSESGGLAMPDFVSIAKAFGFKTVSIRMASELRRGLGHTLNLDGPVFCNIEIDSRHRIIPLVKYGSPNEDSEPFLHRKEFLRNMIVPPLESRFKRIWNTKK